MKIMNLDPARVNVNGGAVALGESSVETVLTIKAVCVASSPPSLLSD
jgi:hypothetical protein